MTLGTVSEVASYYFGINGVWFFYSIYIFSNFKPRPPNYPIQFSRYQREVIEKNWNILPFPIDADHATTPPLIWPRFIRMEIAKRHRMRERGVLEMRVKRSVTSDFTAFLAAPKTESYAFPTSNGLLLPCEKRRLNRRWSLQLAVYILTVGSYSLGKKKNCQRIFFSVREVADKTR